MTASHAATAPLPVAPSSTSPPLAPDRLAHAASSAASAFPVTPSASELPPAHSLPAVLGALGGMAVLGLATTLGSGSIETIVPGTILLLASLLGAVLLTAPALLALHQFFKLSARPEAMVSALAHALVAGGRVAMGVAPVGLFFAVTTSLWPLALLAGFALCGVVTAMVAVGSLSAVEAAVGSPPSRFRGLVLGWAGLTTLIALRIGYDVLVLIFEGGVR